jgi:hypothetical protein
MVKNYVYLTRPVERILVRRGLPFLLQHPVRSIRNEIIELFLKILFLVTLIILIFVVMFLTTIFDSDKIFYIIQTHDMTWWQFFFYAFLGSWVLAVIPIFLIAVWHAFAFALKLWSRVGISFALMISVVALIFFLSDTWRILGEIAWWRMIICLCIGSVAILSLLYRSASHIFRDTDKERRKDPVKFAKDVEHWLVTYMVRTGLSPSTSRLPGLASFNLRLVLTLLFILRILVAAFIIFLAFFAVGAVMIDRHSTLSLLNVNYFANLGWSADIVVEGHHFFISEVLLKVALWLASIAAVYFVVVTMTTNQDQAYGSDEVTFLREVLALWSFYKGVSKSSGFQIDDFPRGAVGLREAVRYASYDDDMRLIYEFFRDARVYALATCSPEEFAAAPNTDRLVYERKRSNGPMLDVSTRRKGLEDEANRRKNDLNVEVHIVVVAGSWLLATLDNDATVIIDSGQHLTSTAELKISTWRTSS